MKMSSSAPGVQHQLGYDSKTSLLLEVANRTLVVDLYCSFSINSTRTDL
jgi:hypothetical protein